MNTTNLVPSADVLPLPAPVPLLHFLLLLTFFVHVIFMNCLLGGVLLALWSRIRSRTSGDAHGLLADQLARLLPTLVAGTVTFGVAPLLFLQVLFGQFFFSSSVIMGWPWFTVVPILILAYYGTYLQSFAADKLGAFRLPLFVLTALLFVTIAFIYTNNVTLMLRPDRWGEIYFTNPGGTNWNSGEPMLLARYLHMVLGAVAVAGLFAAWLGRFKQKSDPTQADFLRRHGLSVFAWLTAVNIGVGLWFYLTLESPVRKLMMGESLAATILFGVGAILSVVLLGLVARAKLSRNGNGLTLVTVVAAITLVDMILLRDRVRAGYLDGIYAPATFPLQTQFFNLVLFVLLLVAGLVTLLWMLRKLRAAW
jgi:hypothetical protein